MGNQNYAKLKILYDKALEYKELACWNWMYDSDLYSVINPETSERAYCSVLGANKEVFGLTMYLGPEGIKSYLKILEAGYDSVDDSNVLRYLSCIVLTFEDKQFLKKEELALIKKLGCKCQGRNGYPVLNKNIPTYFELSLNDSDIDFVTIILEQSIYVAKKFREDSYYLRNKDNNILTRFKKEKNWVEKYIKIENFEYKVPILDDIKTKMLQINCQYIKDEFIFDLSCIPELISENNVNYFPLLFLIINSKTSIVLEAFVFKPDNYIDQIMQLLINFFKTNKIIPSRIKYSDEETGYIIKDICDKLNIKLKYKRKINVLNSIKSKMKKFYQNGSNNLR